MAFPVTDNGSMIDDAITGTGLFVNYQTLEIGAVAFSSAVICSKKNC